jgi:hypothetical protein
MEGLIIIVLFITACVSGITSFCCAVEEDTKTSLICTLILIISLFLLFYPSYKLDDINYTRPEPYVTHKIMALADNTMLSGRIHLRSGYINENLYYLYGYKTANGGMKTQKVLADTATVFFDDSVQPYANWYKEEKHFWYFSSVRYTCDIYVPSNSLAADYTIDLQ